MASRDELIQKAQAKFRRQQLLAQAQSKWASENAPMNDEEPVPETGAGQAALEHFGNAAAFGYLPHLQSAAAAVTPDPNSDVNEKLKAQGFTITEPEDTYLARRDANIARLQKEGEEHPYASAAGTVGGVLASGIAMGGAGKAAQMATPGGAGLLTRGAYAAGRIGQAAKTGAIMGALANPGDVEGEISPLQLSERAQNAKAGAVVGGVVQGAVEAAPVVLNGIRAVGRRLGAAVSGLSHETVSQYAKRTDEINNLIKTSGGDMTAAADQVRQEAQDAIRATRSHYSAQIGKALESAPKDPVADIAPVVDQLNKVKARLNPNLQSEAVGQIEDTIAKLQTEGAASGGKVSVQQLNQITDFLQGRAKSAYMKGGQIFQNAKEAAQAAKGAAAVSRKMLNSISPEIAQANNKLALLHNLEDRLNPNLIKPGGPDSALFAAGSGANPRNAKMLSALGDVSGYPLLERSKDLAAARTFANPSLLPADATGKAVARQLVLGGIGHAVAGPAGWLAAGAASPAAVKLAINAGNAARPMGQALSAVATQTPRLAQRVAQEVVNPTRYDRIDRGEQSPQIIQSEPKNPGRDVAGAPKGGPDRWARTGLQKLGISGPEAERMLKSKEGKQLLIEASDLKPGSERMKRIQERLRKLGGGK